jgi:hypothetical protein
MAGAASGQREADLNSLDSGSNAAASAKADVPAVKKPRGRPRKRAADVAGAASGQREAALNSLDSGPNAAASAEAGRREDPTATACLDGGAAELPLATGVFARGGEDGAGDDADDALMAAAVDQLGAAAFAINPKLTYRMVRPRPRRASGSCAVDATVCPAPRRLIPTPLTNLCEGLDLLMRTAAAPAAEALRGTLRAGI